MKGGVVLEFFKTYIRQCRASVAVEFSLIAPILIMLLAGTVDVGFYVTERMEVQNTAHAVAEYVSLMQDDANAQTVAEESYGRNIEGLTVNSDFFCECADGVAMECPTVCGGQDYQRRYVRITVNGSFSPIFPFPGVPESVGMQGYARMRVD
jgi:Flp pilus assembly protein TadG